MAGRGISGAEGSMKETKDELAGLPGLGRRAFSTARLAVKVGLKAARKNLSPNAVVTEIGESKAVAAAEKLLTDLDGLKGLVMKFGQMASYLDPAMPPAARKVLARLQAGSTPLAYPVIAAIVERELGAPPAKLYDTFEERPFAAASIGQVHRATWNGQALAVKVQYPDVETAIRRDLTTIGPLARLALVMSPADGGGLVAELRDRVLEECDYRREAENQRLFGKLLAGIDGVHVPAVIAERSTGRVLTSELMPGARFQEFADTASQAARDRAGMHIWDVCFTSLWRFGLLNADPHPGNYLFADDGSVTFLDYGCVKRFEPDFMERWKRLARAIVSQDQRAFRTALVETGLVKEHRKFDWDTEWTLYRYLYEPVLTDEPFTFTPEWVSKTYELILWKNPNKFHEALPRDWLFVNRLQWGLFSVLADLRTTARFAEPWRRALEGPLVATQAG
jgi:predicted unusual protein kinase regulating ubiquinone biosynthesis (AarF/ABC1/UbiB family)